MAPTISVLMMTLDGADRIERALSSIADHCDQIVVCVDNKTKDNSVEIASRFTRDVYGFDFVHWGQAKDNMLQYAKGEWILLVDDDEDFSPDDAPNIRLACETAGGFDMLIIPRVHWLDFERTKLDERQPYPDGQRRLHRNVPYIKCGDQFAHASPGGFRNEGWIPYGVRINHYNAVYHDREWLDNRTNMYNDLFIANAGISYEEYKNYYVRAGRTSQDFYAELMEIRDEQRRLDVGGGEGDGGL